MSRRVVAVVLTGLVLPLLVLVPTASAEAVVRVVLRGIAAPAGEVVTVSLCAVECATTPRGPADPALTGGPGRALQVAVPVDGEQRVQAELAGVPVGTGHIHLSTSVPEQTGYVALSRTPEATFPAAGGIEVGELTRGFTVEHDLELPPASVPAPSPAPEDEEDEDLDELPDLDYRARIAKHPGAAMHADGLGTVTMGRFSQYTRGTRFELAGIWCDGVVRRRKVVVGNGSPFTLTVKRGYVEKGTYWRFTASKAGYNGVTWYPGARFDGCTAAQRRKDATFAVKKWGEPTHAGVRIGRPAAVSTTKVKPGAALTHRWYVGGKLQKQKGRRLAVTKKMRGKVVRVVIVVRKDGRTVTRKHWLGRPW